MSKYMKKVASMSKLKRKVTKASDHNNVKSELSKNGDPELYYNTISYQKFPANDQYKLRVFHEMELYITNEAECYDIETFADYKGIPPNTLLRWIKEKEEYAEIYAKCKRIIGRRLRKLGFDRNLNMNHTSQYVLPTYNNDYHEAMIWRRQLETDAAIAIVEKRAEVETENITMPKAVLDYMFMNDKDGK